MSAGGDPEPRRRLTQAEAKEKTRRQLLAAAAEVFAQKGFAGASLEEISELAGYTTGALYHHFTNKEQLFLELLRGGWSRQIANWVKAVGRVIEDEVTDPFEALSALVVKRSRSDHELDPLHGEFWLCALRNPEAMQIVAEKLSERVESLAPSIESAMERVGTPPGIASDEMTTLVLALFVGLVRRRRIDPDSVPDDLFARALRRLLGAEPDPVDPNASAAGERIEPRGHRSQGSPR